MLGVSRVSPKPISDMNARLSPAQAIEAAARAGFDINLIECNLALTPEDRARRHDEALALALAFREAGELRYAQSALAAAKAR